MSSRRNPWEVLGLLGAGAIAGAALHKLYVDQTTPKTPVKKTLIKPSTLDGKRPMIICHRGSGYFPEHTIEGYADIIRCHPEFIEFDVVSTKDHQMIIRHDVLLDGTTNVLDTEEFKDKKTRKTAPSHDGEDNNIEGFFACDFTLEEIKKLCATQRWDWRTMTEDRMHCRVPTVLEAAKEIEEKSKEMECVVGLYIETKRPQWHRDIGLPLEEKLLEDIIASGFSGPVIIQSFEEGSLRRFKEIRPEWPRVQLLIDLETAAHYGVDKRESLPDERDVEGLQAFYERVGEYADGVGVWKDDILKDPFHPPSSSNIVSLAHEYNLFVHVYTFRSDIKFLHVAYGGNPTEEYMLFFRLGIDGAFSDFASHAVHARDVFTMVGDDYPFANLALTRRKKKEVKKTEKTRQAMANEQPKATKYVRE